MKTLKYRSIVGTLGVAILSVFLFTSCEKESEGIPNKPDRLSKFKSLTFTGEAATTSSSAGTGTFTGNNNNITYTPPEETNDLEFAPALDAGQAFTNPLSTGSNFSIDFDFFFNFSLGGGKVKFDGKKYNLNFGFCLSSDIFGYTDQINGTSASEDDLEMFVGIAGEDFNVEEFNESDQLENPLGLILYIFSYNGGSSIGDFNAFNGYNEDGVDSSAFIMAVTFGNDVDDTGLYFATAGTVNFSGSSVDLKGVKMSKVIEGSLGGINVLDTESSNLAGSLECGGFSFDMDEN